MEVFFAPLIEWLKCLVLFLVGCIEWVLITVGNLVVLALSGLLSLAFLLLPEWSPPSLEFPPYFAEVNYFLPLDTLVTVMTLVLSVLLVWPVVRLILNWVKGD